jgi:ABC-2 type transport system permease protein
MLDLFRAEWKKVTGNRWLVGCTVWIFPLLGCGLISLLTIIFLADSDSRQSYVSDPLKWTDTALIAWIMPNNPIGRLFLMGFAATIFAGEYQYQTLKSVLPGNRRLMIIFTKYIALASFVVIAFVVTMIILVLGVGLLNLIFGADYPPAVTSDTVGDFLEDLLLNAFLTFASTLIFSGIAGLVSIFTRSILFGVMVSLFLSLLEWLGITLGLALLTLFLPKSLADIYLLTPTYNTGNIIQWVNANEASPPLLSDGSVLSMTESILILIFWLIFMLGLSAFAFQRQDIQ